MATVKPLGLRIVSEEHRGRQAHLTQHLAQAGLRGAVLFGRTHVLYYTGFAYIPTERPIALILSAAGQATLFLPRLEVEHAQDDAAVDEVVHYQEYPGDPHPMIVLAESLASLGLGTGLGFDLDGYPPIFGYQGPSLRSLTQGTLQQVTPIIERQMMIKSPAELQLIRESVRWGNLAHSLLQRYTKAGASEIDVAALASAEATRAMLDAIGPIYQSQSPFFSGASATYRGQVGRGATIPGALASDIRFCAGDVLVSEARAPVWGYDSELERTMIIDTPSQEQRQFFTHMSRLQEVAMESMGPGVACSEVDRRVREYYERHDLIPYWRHHSGHSIGLRYHEGPFLDIHDPTIMAPGMVFTVEPGIYVPGLGGFRHSDTVVVTEVGIEILTYYPRDLDSLTLHA